MKRWWAVGAAALAILAGCVWLGRPAAKPGAFSGTWYCAEGNRQYRFDSGLILDGEDSAFRGAYSYAQKKVLLFVTEVEGLQTEKELYLVQRADGDLLCEDETGTGKVYFSRNQ